MDVELLEILDFLRTHRPFDQLPENTLIELPEALSIRYVRRDCDIPLTDQQGTPLLCVVRTGAAEVRTTDNELLARHGEGDVLGYRAAHGFRQDDGIAIRHVAIEDSLLYQLPAPVVDRLCNEHRAFDFYLSPPGGERLRGAVRERAAADDTPLHLMTTELREVLAREPVSVSPNDSIRTAATRMSEQRISSILVVEQEYLFGIVTDRDLRLRVIAKGLDYDQPVSTIMTGAPTTIDIGAFAYEALQLMARQGVHHLPVLDGERVAGVVTTSDFLERHTTSGIYLAADIHRQRSVDGLVTECRRLPELLSSLVSAGASADRTGRVISGIADAVVVRLLELAELELGPPPVDYTWVVAGSQARLEQTVATDQDNALILDDSFDPERHAAYFRTMSDFVCDALDRCGYEFCPGDMMAKNPQWRMTLNGWKQRVAQWTDEPVPEALMLICIFFDMRYQYGDRSLFDELREYTLTKTRGNSIFLSHLSTNALSRVPPLGFFRNFVLTRGSEHDKALDLKHLGVVPIVDLARVYALSAGVAAVNTSERLQAATAAGELSERGGEDLRDALAFMAAVRFRHQVNEIRAGHPPSHFVMPESLSRFERSHLKDAFTVVRSLQRALAQRFKA